MIQSLLVAVIASFLFGATGGGIFVHRWYSVSALHAQVKALKADRQRYKEALQLGEKIDDESAQAEITNEDIERALRLRAAQLAPPAQVPDGHVCLDADWVLSVGALR